MTTEEKPQEKTGKNRSAELEARVAALETQLQAEREQRARMEERLAGLLEIIDAKLDLMVPDNARAMTGPEVDELLRLDPEQKFEVLEDFKGGGGSMSFRRGQTIDGRQGSVSRLIRSGVKVGLPLDKMGANAKLTAARKKHLQSLIAAKSTAAATAKLAEVKQAEADLTAKQAEAERATMEAQERVAQAAAPV